MLRNGTMRIRGRIVGLPTTHHHHPSRCACHAATPRSFTPNPPIAPPTSHTDTSTPPSRPPTTLPSPRIDLKAITANPKAYTANHIARRVRIPSDTVFHVTRLHTTALEIRRKLDTIRNKQRDVGQLIRMGGGEDALLQARKLKTRVMEYEKALTDTEAELQDLVELLPNTTHPEVPLGDECHAVQLERFGPEIIPADPRRDHLDICTRFGWVDSPSSALATGTSWPYLKGTLAILEQALVQYALSISIRYGFTPVQTPDVIKEDIMSRCGFRPRDSSGQTYHISTSPNETSHLVLAATAEIPLAALSADQILPCLPRRLVGHGKAFRAEAGARGADTRGLYRVHQFTKVELFAVTAEEESEAMMEELRAVQKEIFKGLGLSCRVLDMPTEELGASAFRKYDVEAWMPGRGKWGEISSTSNCTDYQSRRLLIRHKTPTGTSFAHTLNGTAAAIPRLLVALIENGARFEGEEVVGVDLPISLKRFWLGGEEEDRIRWV